MPLAPPVPLPLAGAWRADRTTRWRCVECAPGLPSPSVRWDRRSRRSELFERQHSPSALPNCRLEISGVNQLWTRAAGGDVSTVAPEIVNRDFRCFAGSTSGFGCAREFRAARQMWEATRRRQQFGLDRWSNLRFRSGFRLSDRERNDFGHVIVLPHLHSFRESRPMFTNSRMN